MPIVCKSLIENIVKKIIKHQKRLEEYYTIRTNLEHDEFVNRMKNTLVVCNHDLFIIDFFSIPYLFSTHNVPLSVIIDEEFVKKNETVFETMTNKFNVKLIPRKGAVATAIEHMKEGRSLVIFFDPKQYQKIEEKKSIPSIIEATGCKPVYLYYEFCKSYKKKNFL